jgi:hypothetical protein
LEEGISQLAKGAESGFFTSNNDVNPCVWNFPIDIAFKSTNVYGTLRFREEYVGCGEETGSDDELTATLLCRMADNTSHCLWF